MRNLFCLFAALALFGSCSDSTESAKQTVASDSTNPRKDPHTQSNADQLKLEHLFLDIAVHFENRTISGAATWTISNPDGVDSLKLDTYGLQIDSVQVDGAAAGFALYAPLPHLGQCLAIPVKKDSREVRIAYRTGDSARALQWLDPEQTLSKKKPFLYTQSESIYARSWVPAADGPGIRFTYDARVQVPKDLMALMSAENPQSRNDSGIYHFHMDKPIPAYLMALAVGDVEFRSIDERTGVYAEPAMIEKAHSEFRDVGKMVTTAERLYGPYQWGRYDVLVLPPGFPIGGMENPKLTFCTPTIISGDRSLVNLIAHELAHSWSGNLVTNATWSDIWMNEGFTVYFERRISEAMTDKSYVDMLWELGYQDLQAEVEDIGPNSPDTWLKLKLAGRDPDEGLSDIAYEKGAPFLWLIEQKVGRERFDAFLKAYFSEHAFKTITTEEFLEYLRKNLIKGDKALEESININAWVYGPGIPANCPRADSARFSAVSQERNRFLSGSPATDLKVASWTTHEWLHFLRKMPETLTADQMKALDAQFHFTTSGNSEIADLWYLTAVKHQYEAAYPAMEKFLSKVGRQKFLLPVYDEMMKTKQDALAKQIYGKYRQNYHPLTQAKLDKVMAGNAPVH